MKKLPVGTKVHAFLFGDTWVRGTITDLWPVREGHYLVEFPGGWGRLFWQVCPEEKVRPTRSLRNYLKGLYEEP